MKIGTRIRIIAGDEQGFYDEGDTGTILDTDDPAATYVRFDTPRRGDTDWWVAPQDLEVIE